MKNPKVLQLGKFYPILGGVEKVAYDLMIGLSEQDVDCDMMCAAATGSGGIIPVKNTPGSFAAAAGSRRHRQ